EIPQRLLRAPRDSLGAGELRHEQPAAAQPANHAPKQRVRDARHGRQHRRRPYNQIAYFVFSGNHGSLGSLAEWKWDISDQRSVIGNRLGESRDQAKDFLGGSSRLPEFGGFGPSLTSMVLALRNRRNIGSYLVSFGGSFSFKNSSSRKNFLPRAPLNADHSGSPESLASAARTAASLESISSK